MPIIKHWTAAIAWMSVIFLFSTDIFSGSNTSSFFRPFLSSLLPSLTTEQIDLIHFLVRKFGHWSEYFILCLFLMGAVRERVPDSRQSLRLVLSLALATLYAIGDEWHQSFVPSRSSSMYDVLIDSIGAVCGALWYVRSKKIPDKSY